MGQPEDILAKHFGHTAFRPGQKAVIESLLADRSALAIFPTGGGKSICYQLPALVFEGLTLVVSPLIALMKDQVDALVLRDIPAARLDSTLSAEQASEIYRQLANGDLKLLYVAPERLANERFRNRLESLKIDLLAIDEVHCISEWGHNFRPDYLKLARFAKDLQIPRVLGLTATATPQVADDICRHFDIAQTDHHQLTFYRPNLDLAVTPLADRERLRYLVEQIRSSPQQATIVYTTLQFTAESVASHFKKQGLKARPYHAGLRPEVRAEIQEEFMSGETPIICATIAFGMGIDKADIRAVYHYNLPKSLENYTQEIGRAGRDGQQSRCEMLACADDLRILSNFTYGDTPQPDSLRGLLRALLDHKGEFDISVYELSRAHDIRPLVINTLLTYLELEGFLIATSPFYSTYKIAFVRDLDHLLKGFNARRQDFLRRLFASGKRGRKWIEIHPDEAAFSLNESREKIVKTIGYLEDHGDITVQPAGVRQGYRLLKKPEDFNTLHRDLSGLFQKREESDLARLQQVVDHALSPRCLYQSLLAHFGEEIESCDHCHRCRGQAAPSELPASPAPEISSEDLASVQALIARRIPALRHPRSLARFLCGLTSPATSYAWVEDPTTGRKKRLTTLDTYALLEQHAFRDVLDLCEAQIIS